MWIKALDRANLPASSKMTGYTPLVLRGVTEDGGDRRRKSIGTEDVKERRESTKNVAIDGIA
jgi:hypothetical protein